MFFDVNDDGIVNPVNNMGSSKSHIKKWNCCIFVPDEKTERKKKKLNWKRKYKKMRERKVNSRDNTTDKQLKEAKKEVDRISLQDLENI